MNNLVKLIPAGLVLLLLLFSASYLPAQNTLPDPHNDDCWSSLKALRGCQLQAFEQAQDYAQRCTAYPEYQCIPEYVSLEKQPSARQAVNRPAQKHASKRTSTSPDVASDGTVQQSN